MKRNRIPTATRLQSRIHQLSYKEEAIWVPARKGNPYYCCNGCGIHTPEYSILGRHYKGCPHQGLLAEISHYKRLLNEVTHA